MILSVNVQPTVVVTVAIQHALAVLGRLTLVQTARADVTPTLALRVEA